MSPRTCLSCRRLNPPSAAYCYHDGTPLVTEVPADAGPQQFPSPFVFPSGTACRSFEELARTCRQNWEEAGRLLQDRSFQMFLAAFGRADLVQAADRAAAHPDPDLGLDEFLAGLPDCRPSPAGLEVGCDELDLGAMCLGLDRIFTLTLRNTGERLLSGVVRSESCLWLAVGTPRLHEKRFKATAHEQLEIPLHVLGKHLRAAVRPQVAEMAIESNGGAHRVQVQIRVAVTPFPDGVARGSQTPRQLAEKGRTALPEFARLLEDGTVARWYQSNGWDYPIPGPAATGRAAVQQYFEVLGLTPPPRVELRTAEVILHGAAGGAARGQVVLGTPDKRPVYAHAQADQPWLTVGPPECRGTEVILPLSVAAVPACAGQTLEARLSVQANGKQHFQVPVRLHVEPAQAGLPPLPDSLPQAPGEGVLPPARAPGFGGARGRLALVCLLLTAGLGAAGVVAFLMGRDGGSDAPARPPVGAAASGPLAPTTGKPVALTTKKATGSEPESPLLRELVGQLQDPDVGTNRKAIEKLADVDDSEARKAIPALVAAAGRHDDESFRQRVARELQRLGPPLPQDTACLVDALRVPHPALRRYVLSALKEMGDRAREAIGVLAEALKHPDPEVRPEALAILNTLGPTARGLTLRALLNPAGDTSPEPLRGALAALLDLGRLTAEEVAVPAEALGDVRRATWVRCCAADVLAEAGPRAGRAVPVLLSVLQEKADPVLLTRSVSALGRIGDRRPEVLTVLVAVATSAADETVRLESLKVLKQLDPSALSTAQILERWPAEKSGVRAALAELLRTRLVGLKAAEMAEVRSLLRHKDPEIIQVGLRVVHARKKEAAGVAADVAALMPHDEAGVRYAALGALQAIGPDAARAVPALSRVLLERWPAEPDPAVRKALGKAIVARFANLKADEMTELLPLLRDKDPEMVQVGLKVVRERKEEAAPVAYEVTDLLKHQDTAVREAAAAALEAIGPAASPKVPGLFRIVLERRAAEKDPAVRRALAGLLAARLAALKPEQMTELLPLLRHQDPEMVLVGLRAIQERKEEAAVVAAEVAGLFQHDAESVREAALAALEALGPAARKALPKLFEVLDATPKHQGTSLALTVSRFVDLKDAVSVRRLVPFLLDGLHPESLRGQGEKTEAQINDLLRKIGQPAVDGIFAVLNPDSRGVDEINYRVKLYDALAGLGPQCKSGENYETLRELRGRELKKKYPDVIEAAGKALAAMSPK